MEGIETDKGPTPLSPLDEVGQRHAKRRTDALLSQLREKAEKQKTTTMTRQVLIDCVPRKVRSDRDCDRQVFDEFKTKFSVILRAICSKQAVNTEQLDQLCKETSIKLVTHWPTFRFTPFVHQVLAHSAALIHKNESQGLGTLSEKPLEHNNKYLRSYQEKLARKTTQQANLTDVLTRLWGVKSDPIVRSFRCIVKLFAMDSIMFAPVHIDMLL